MVVKYAFFNTGFKLFEIPPTAVGGSFQMAFYTKHKQRLWNPTSGSWWIVHIPCHIERNLNYPPTAVGGIYDTVQELFVERILTNPPTAVGGILQSLAALQTRAEISKQIRRNLKKHPVRLEGERDVCGDS